MSEEGVKYTGRKGEESVALTKGDNNGSGTTSQMADEDMRDGCIILGQDAERGNRYCTRYHIERLKQRELLSAKDTLVKSCCPCCLPARQTSCWRTTWQCIRSELFLVSLHMLVILLGVLKEALDLRQISEDIHFAHSLVETAVALLVIVLRIVSAWHAFKNLKISRHKVEYVDVKLGIKTRSKAIKKLLKAYTVMAVLICLYAVVCFLLFYFLAHLGWTILSNNSALIWVMAMDPLLRSRMSAESNLVEEDHRKAVTFEMSLLLSEAIRAPDGPQRAKVNRRVEHFQQALKDTDSFSQPDYISLPENYKLSNTQMNELTTLEVISG